MQDLLVYKRFLCTTFMGPRRDGELMAKRSWERNGKKMDERGGSGKEG